MEKLDTAAKTASKTNSSLSKKGEDKKEKTLECILKDGLKAMYSAETQLIEALPEMAKAAESEDLQDAFNKHLQETKRHAERLEKIFSKLGIEKSEVKKCLVMESLINEGKKVMEEFEEGPVRDSALIIGAQKVEHHEVASYGSLCELCDVLGYHKVGDILDRTLEEEENTDEDLTNIAKHINDEAYESTESEKNYEYENQEL